ncbi:hypothetical protein DPMN_044887 [Dreissena polymorpha]|uniref:Uncharacterized protein n=1 Tax=Dreissena polymorpha TaxID=45954 RepID=A0A9D4D328_DREPO|nr:hypothetical protein DPMN_044885 [Dreissena polymorpha]KAH3738256.1 hypothetical protein DPMN_044887 [Dreissena polymorpha]
MTRIQNYKPNRSGPGITPSTDSNASLQGGCEYLANGANPAIKMETKGATIETRNVRTIRSTN